MGGQRISNKVDYSYDMIWRGEGEGGIFRTSGSCVSDLSPDAFQRSELFLHAVTVKSESDFVYVSVCVCLLVYPCVCVTMCLSQIHIQTHRHTHTHPL